MEILNFSLGAWKNLCKQFAVFAQDDCCQFVSKHSPVTVNRQCHVRRMLNC